MSNRRIEMFEYRQIIMHMRLGESDRIIAKSGLMSRRKLKQVRLIADEQGWLYHLTVVPKEAELAKYFLNSTIEKNAHQEKNKVHPFKDQITKWVHQGISARVIHRVLNEQYNFKGAYNCVQRFIKNTKSSLLTDLTVPLTFLPAQAAQVDFGQGPKLIHPETNKLCKTWFFVMTLCWSRHQYAEIVFDQSLPTWLDCHARAFSWFGGVPKKVIIDNPKCAITKACYYHPEVQRSYAEYAEAYQFIISPCPIADPQKKGRVESGVKYLKRAFVPLRIFRSSVDANKQLHQWVLEVAGNRIHGTTRQKPLSQFEEVERCLLKPLPETLPELSEWVKVRVYRDCHVRFKYCRYSAPYQFAGQTLWLRANGKTIRLYESEQLIAIHTQIQTPDTPATILEHLPPETQTYFQRDATWCEENAQIIGPWCTQVIKKLLNDSTVDYLRASQAIIQLKENYGKIRLEKACQRAIFFQNINYQTIKAILKKGLESEILPARSAFDQLAKVYQGKSVFCRDVQELIH